MKLVAGAMALIIAAVGVVGVISPWLVLELARSLLAPGALYVVAAVRIIFGIVLVSVASTSRLPKTIRVLGIVIIAAGVLTPFFGVERSQAVFDWWSSQSVLFMRAWSGLAVICGLFVIYALTPRRQAAA
jgi:hypothetical protein